MLSLADHEVIFQFISMLNVRVPARRDAVEFILAEQLKATAKLLDESGRLPPRPTELEDLFDHVGMSVDPHQSIHAMADLMKGFGNLLAVLGFQILHNDTDMSFITSDNPVLHFDPSVSEKEMKPYVVQLGHTPIELLFPIDSKHMLHGHTDLKPIPGQLNITYKSVNDPEMIMRFNRLVSRYAYEVVFANSTAHETVIKEYAHLSPVARVDIVSRPHGKLIISRYVFGQRRKKSKWKHPSA